MNCKKIEEWILRSFDHRLQKSTQSRLDAHLESCPRCRKKKREYTFIFESLRSEEMPEPKPYFWERLQPKMKERKKGYPWRVWKQFGLKAIPLSLLLVILVSAGIFLFSPSVPAEADLSQTGNFLLKNTNPLEETQTYLTEEGGSNKHLMLLFSSLDETESLRRYFP